MQQICLLLFMASLVSLSQAAPHTEEIRRLENRISQLERETRTLKSETRSLRNEVEDIGFILIFFGFFCALWAQNTGRNAWLWFFLGFFFHVITGFILLYKNSSDRKR